MDNPRFEPNDIVFAVANEPGWCGFHMIGNYRISKVSLIPKNFTHDGVPNTEKRYVYYGAHFAGELELLHVFKDKDEFIEFLKDYSFEFKSPVLKKA